MENKKFVYKMRLLFFLLISAGLTPSYAELRPVAITPLEFGVSLPLSEIEPAVPQRKIGRVEPIKIPFPQPKISGAFSPEVEVIDPVVQTFLPTQNLPNPILTFEGISDIDIFQVFGTPFTPPDTNGDVGPNHYVQMVNLLYQVFDKSGNPLTDPLDLGSLFASAGVTGPCATSFQANSGISVFQIDPIVLYDSLADRWLLSQAASFNSNGIPVPPFFECIAISQTPDPTGSYFVYAFPIPNSLGDFPKFGVWPDGYYMTVDFVDQENFFKSVGVFAFDRAKMLAGKQAVGVFFDLGLNPSTSILRQMLPSDVDGPSPPAGTPNFVAGLVFPEETGNPAHGIRIFEFRPDFSNINNSTFIERPESPILVAPFNPNLCNFSFDCIPQPETTQKLDAFHSIGLSYRLQYRNFGIYESLVTNHTVNVGDDRAGIRYYEIRRNSPIDGIPVSPFFGSFFIHQQGTFAPNDGNNRWMGSAAMDSFGNIAVGYSVSSQTTFPSIRYTGRLANDLSGQLAQGEAILQTGSGSQDGSNRWGDYSMMAVDPKDDCTFWYTNEYYTAQENGTIDWQTRVGTFRFPSCTVKNINNCVISAILGALGKDFFTLVKELRECFRLM